MNHETITGTLSWYKILQLSGPNLIRAKQRLHMRRRRSYVKLLGAVARTESCIYRQLDGIWGEHLKILSWNHRTSTPHRSETNGIAERAVRRVKEGTLSSIATIRIGSKMVVCFYGMLPFAMKTS